MWSLRFSSFGFTRLGPSSFQRALPSVTVPPGSTPPAYIGSRVFPHSLPISRPAEHIAPPTWVSPLKGRMSVPEPSSRSSPRPAREPSFHELTRDTVPDARSQVEGPFPLPSPQILYKHEVPPLGLSLLIRSSSPLRRNQNLSPLLPPSFSGPLLCISIDS